MKVKSWKYEMVHIGIGAERLIPNRHQHLKEYEEHIFLGRSSYLYCNASILHICSVKKWDSFVS